MGEIKKIEIDGEKIYIKKSKIFGWGIVHPLFNEDESINWFNLLTGGSWIRVITIVIILIIFFLLVQEYTSQANVLAKCLEQNTLSKLKIINLTI